MITTYSLLKYASKEGSSQKKDLLVFLWCIQWWLFPVSARSNVNATPLLNQKAWGILPTVPSHRF